MQLPQGTHLGPYEITGSIGAGGMGEVYRAIDSRLGRTVAIKVLPERLAFTFLGPGGADVYLVDRPGGKARPFVETRFNEHEATLSPDGRFIAYNSDESGAPEIYIRAVDQPEEKLQVSVSGGREPLWSRDGRRLYFRLGQGFLAADITIANSAVVAGTPRLLFEGDFVEGAEANGYDVAADGTFILLQRNGRPGDGTKLHVRFGSPALPP